MNKNIVTAFLLSSLFFLSQCSNHTQSGPGTAADSTFTKPDPAKQKDTLAFGDKDWISHGLEGKIYYLPENTSNLPASFDTMKVQGTIYTKTIDVPERSWSTGFPGVGNRFEWFAIVYKGTFEAKKAGRYTFRLSSDDGSKLYIDDSLVINNDGVHGTSSGFGSMDLDGSGHRITIQYFQGPRFAVALQLFAKLDKDDEQIFPGNYFTVATPGGHRGILWWVIGGVAGILLIVVLMRGRKKKSGADK